MLSLHHPRGKLIFATGSHPANASMVTSSPCGHCSETNCGSENRVTFGIKLMAFFNNPSKLNHGRGQSFLHNNDKKRLSFGS
jgi:hypothetical protein